MDVKFFHKVEKAKGQLFLLKLKITNLLSNEIKHCLDFLMSLILFYYSYNFMRLKPKSQEHSSEDKKCVQITEFKYSEGIKSRRKKQNI